MTMKHHWLALLPPMLFLLGACTGGGANPQRLIHDTFPEAQAEIREVVQAIMDDAMTANVEGLQAAHLHSDKFTKFGPRAFERQDVASTNESEAAFFSSISNYKQECRDLKVDVFGNVAIATYYPHVSFEQDGELKQGSGRQTFVFLNTEDGWKLVHEHGTSRTQE